MSKARARLASPGCIGAVPGGHGNGELGPADLKVSQVLVEH